MASLSSVVMARQMLRRMRPLVCRLCAVVSPYASLYISFTPACCARMNLRLNAGPRAVAYTT